MKTTCPFDENNVSFYEKQRLVFSERSEAKKQSTNHPSKIVFRSVKTSTITSTRAHAYARITGLFAFLLSQVSQHTL